MRCARVVPVLGVLAVLLALPLSVARSAEADPVGKKIENFTLKNTFGKETSLAEYADRDVVIVAFVGAECPLAKLYGPRLAELAAQLDGKRVAILGIDSNRQDSLQEMQAYARRHGIEFPLLKDVGNAVADQFGAQRTPEIFVLDRDRVVRYHGRVDDQYGFAEGVGYQRPAASRADLVEAVNELLAGKSVSVAKTEAIGCLIGRVREANDKSPVTYSNQIARVFADHCVECHRPGRIGPFAMNSYDDVAGWGAMIKEVVDEGRMPPWHANPAHGEFANDTRLSDEDKKLIVTWVDNGCPEGNPAELPQPKQYAEGWTIGEPDQIVYMDDKQIEVPAEGVIDYFHFVVDPGWTEDKWVMAAEARPESLETVHHILVFVQSPEGQRRGFGRGRGGSAGGGLTGGNLIAGYAPGSNPLLHTDGTTAMHVKAGSKLIFQLHYTPNGSPAKDRSFIGFKFADPSKVTHVARSTSLINFFFAIPPGASDYSVSAEGMFENEATIANLTPHMHMRGKAFRYEATYPDGTQEVLLDVPAYDFNWQTTYMLKEPKRMPKGTKLVCTAHWDNSEDNLSNPDPKKTVSWGDQSFEEMMIGFYVEVYPKDQVPDRPSGARNFEQLSPAQIFKSLDGNRDGKLTKDELPGRIAERFELADLNGDGGISEQELTLLLKLFGGNNEPRGFKGRKRD